MTRWLFLTTSIALTIVVVAKSPTSPHSELSI